MIDLRLNVTPMPTQAVMLVARFAFASQEDQSR
jgi:hypothetical protein